MPEYNWNYVIVFLQLGHNQLKFFWIEENYKPTKDAGDGITNIEWTPSGKVRKVTKSSGSPIEFRYDALGNRIENKQGAKPYQIHP